MSEHELVSVRNHGREGKEGGISQDFRMMYMCIGLDLCMVLVDSQWHSGSAAGLASVVQHSEGGLAPLASCASPHRQ